MTQTSESELVEAQVPTLSSLVVPTVSAELTVSASMAAEATGETVTPATEKYEFLARTFSKDSLSTERSHKLIEDMRQTL
jgi:hypothetical protein